jgi:exodeoxyribonuclease VII small subunit
MKERDGASDRRASSGATADQDLSFEAALKRLEQVVDRLEGGDLELDAALGAFEAGVKLTASCAAQLEAAERRVEILVQQGTGWVARPFDAEEMDSEGESVDDDSDEDAEDQS